MLKAVIFDIDGTLIDSVDLHAKAWQETLQHFGHDLPYDRVRHEIGKGGDQLMPALMPQGEVDERGEEIESHRSAHFKKEYLASVTAFPDVRALFERIKSDGRRIVLATSADKADVEAYKSIADIGDLIEAETTSDDAERSKPHPDIFDAAMGRLEGVSRDDAIVIGDTPYDAEAAGKAGLRTIGMLCGGFPEAELRAAGCFAIYRDPADLLARYADSPLSDR